MTRKLFPFISALIFAFVLSGCSTPESRIKDNLDAFNKATPEQQSLIKQGRVSIGFTADLVKLAIGDPDRVKSRIDEQGSSEIWLYTTWESESGVVLYSGYYHRHYMDMYPYFTGVAGRHSKEMARVVFREGKVVAVEAEVK